MGNEWMYSYVVEYWRGEDLRKAKGIVSGFSFQEAVSKLEMYYGPDAIYKSSLMIISDTDGGLYEIKNEAVD